MSSEYPELDELQTNYKSAVETWIAAIRKEEALASVNHTIAEVDTWEQAHFDEDEMRSNVKAEGEIRRRAAREVFRVLISRNVSAAQPEHDPESTPQNTPLGNDPMGGYRFSLS